MTKLKIPGYTVIRPIGQGSSATVYLAQDKDNVLVAIKVIDSNKLSTNAEKAAFTEINAMNGLDHKHIVKMIKFICVDSYICIILEYCDGGDLATLLSKKKILKEKMCRRIMQELALALQYLKSNHISHLDLKPHNILFKRSPKLTLKIADFGLMRFMNDETQLNSLCGTPLYMAPEMIICGQYNNKVDLWSIGIIAYECLFGYAPYTSNSIPEIFKKVREISPIKIPYNKVSQECEDLLSGLLRHNPLKRITHEQFFKHPFIDLEHMPSQESYEKGLKAIELAIELDNDERYKAAFCKYCIGLEYLIPYFKNESDQTKREELQLQIDYYLERANRLKKFLKPVKIKKIKTQFSLSNDIEWFPTLELLCKSTPQLHSAIEITNFGYMYLLENDYKSAIENFMTGLNILEELMEREPPGIRYNLLTKQISEWKNQHDYAQKSLKSTGTPFNMAGDLSFVTKDKPKKKSRFIRIIKSLNPWRKKKE